MLRIWNVSWNCFLILACCYCLDTKFCPTILQPHELQPVRLCPWDFPGKNAEVGCHFFFQGIFPIQGLKLSLPHLAGGFFTTEPPGEPILAYAAATKLLQSCPTLCDPIDRSPPGSPIPGILQARTLEWVAISFSRHESEKWKWSRSAVSDS